MKLNGAQILIKALEDQGVETVFGYPGGAVLEIYDAMRNSSLEHILVRHEQGGAHAANGYARASGKVGVCLATSGPGATNLVTGIATAYMDSVPVVFITGQVPKIMVGTDAFQEVDITGITAPIIKRNYLVQNVEELSRIVAEAFYIAKSGRPGPVLIDIPRDVSAASCKYRPQEKIDIRGYKPTVKGHNGMIKKAVKLIKEAKKLVICTGGGVINSESSLYAQKLVDVTAAQVVSTLMGLGSIPGNHEAFQGMLGTYGNRAANEVVQDCDCFLALGMRFDDRVIGHPDKFAPKAKIIHIDVDPAEIGKNITAHLPIVGDLKYILEDIINLLEKEKLPKNTKKQVSDNSAEMLQKGVNATRVLHALQEFVPEDTIITTDVGQHQMWTATKFKFSQPRTLITSGGLGTMGYGIPAALGAQIAMPDKLVIAVTGDGSFQMGMPELGTILEKDLPIKIILFNNSYLGMVRQLQYHYCEKRFTAVKFEKLMDFMALAKAFGAEAFRIEKEEDIHNVLKDAMSNNKFSIIECLIDESDLVNPIVLAGKGLDEMEIQSD